MFIMLFAHLASIMPATFGKPSTVTKLKVNSTAIGRTTLPKAASKPNPVLANPAALKAIRAKAGIINPKRVNPTKTSEVNTLSNLENDNRYNVFENGVVYWKNGTTSAREITPWTRTSSNAAMIHSASWVANKVRATISQKIKAPHLAVGTVSLSSVSGYKHDASGVTNRRHRFTVALRCQRRVSSKLVQSNLVLRLSVLVSWDETRRNVNAAITSHGWKSYSKAVRGISDLGTFVNKRLHPQY